MASRHEVGIYAKWSHAFQRRNSTFPKNSGQNCSISFAIPFGPMEFSFGEERTVATSSCSSSSGTLNCCGQTPQVLGCACWTCLVYKAGSRELPRSVAVAARLPRSLMRVLTLFAIRDGASSWIGRLHSSSRALFLSRLVLLINLSKSLYFSQSPMSPLRFHLP